VTEIEPPVSNEPDEPGESAGPDLDAIERDLDGVQSALARLAEGTYWTDEVTAAPIPAAQLDADPLIRRA